MYPYIHIILPSYTLMAFLGGFCALVYVFFKLERFRVEFTSFIAMFIFSMIGGVAGSRLLFVIAQLGWLMNHFSVSKLFLLIFQSGFVFYGGLFGVISSLYLYTYKNAGLRKRVYRMIAPAIPFFHAFGRIGCFLAGCCYGRELADPIYFMGIRLERIPVQLAESGFEMVLFIYLEIVDRKKENCDLLGIYLVSYALFRFLDEFMRGDAIRGIYLGISSAQWISVLILICYIVKAVRKNPAVPE